MLPTATTTRSIPTLPLLRGHVLRSGSREHSFPKVSLQEREHITVHRFKMTNLAWHKKVKQGPSHPLVQRLYVSGVRDYDLMTEDFRSEDDVILRRHGQRSPETLVHLGPPFRRLKHGFSHGGKPVRSHKHHHRAFQNPCRGVTAKPVRGASGNTSSEFLVSGIISSFQVETQNNHIK